MVKRRASARRKRSKGPRPSGPHLRGGAIVTGNDSTPLYSGAIHYWQLEPAVWKKAVSEVAELGFPIIETYLPWGVHEIRPGAFDFGETRPNLDIVSFLEIVHELGLKAIVRPGPHINAELTYFGLPERVVYDRACQARSPKQDPVLQVFPPHMFPVPSYASTTFLKEASVWLREVAERLAPLRWPNGPIVMVQVDNEGSYYFRDSTYDQDYHPDIEPLWRQFLEKRYETLAATSAAHRATYRRWSDVTPPQRFDAEETSALVRHLDWSIFREHVITRAVSELKAVLQDGGLTDVPTSHNLPLGEQGIPVNSVELETVVDLVGYDYYHARREQRTIKRRTLALAGTHPLPYAPELGIGAPAWFTPLGKDDSLTTALCACAFGLRGFNAYMAVDRNRWYGAPIDQHGRPRAHAENWRLLLQRLTELRFHTLKRRAPVGLVMPREYAQLSRVTSLLGAFSPGIADAVIGDPTIGCREDAIGFRGPIQILWWKYLARFADALTKASVPYVYVDSHAIPNRVDGLEALIVPSFEFAEPERWKHMMAFVERGGSLFYGPTHPHLDLSMNPAEFARHEGVTPTLIDTDEDAERAVVQLLEKRPGLQSAARISPRPLEVTFHEDETGPRVFFVVNPSKETKRATLTLPAPYALQDLITGERFEQSDTICLSANGWTCRMLGVIKAREELP